MLLIGFTAVVAQIVLMRELIVVFCGNEISLGLILATWLLWTALGSGVLGRAVRRVQNSRKLVGALQAAIGLIFPATLLVVRASKLVFNPMPGEILGPGAMLLTSLAILSPFCSVAGLLFAAGSRAYACERGGSDDDATGHVYLLEAVGSGVGGLISSLLLIRYLGVFEIASVLALLNFVSATILMTRGRWLRRAALGMFLGAFLFLVFPLLDHQLETVSLGWLWRGFRVVETRNSIYGNLAVVQTEASRSLFENGLMVSTLPDVAAAEESVHFALLQQSAPSSLLMIGGGLNGSIAQALQHSTIRRLDYVDLDPAIPDLARAWFREAWAPAGSDPRVRTHSIDGRLFLKTTFETFDVIIVNLPDPQTAQLNRFYTSEFFREAAARLTSMGVLSFELRGAEDYISSDLADFLRCIHKTLREVFPEVTFIPGDPVHFFASKHAGVLARSPAELLARLRERRLRTSYVREYYIPFRMAPDRMMDLDLALWPRADTPVNRDFVPIAYAFDVSLWSKRFNTSYRRAFGAIAGVRFPQAALWTGLIMAGLSGILGCRPGRMRRLRTSAGLCVAATGFTLMGLEVLILLGIPGHLRIRLPAVGHRDCGLHGGNGRG